MLNFYGNDTFFHLSAWGGAGLIVLSAMLAAGVVAFYFRVHTKLKTGGKITLAFVLTYLFVWLSPQIYYLYFATMTHDLPLQSIIGLPPSPTDIVWLVLFRQEPTLANHAQALLFWFMLTLAFGLPDRWIRSSDDSQ